METSKCPPAALKIAGGYRAAKLPDDAWPQACMAQPAAASIFHHTASRQPEMLRR